MTRLVLFLCLGVAVLSGCKGSCRQLSEKLCDCTLNTNDRALCLTQVASREGGNQPTAEDEAQCAALLDQCDCRLLDTAQGKVRCGLARPLPDGGF